MYGTEDTTVPSTVVTEVGVVVVLEVTVEVLELVAVEGPVTEVAVEGPDIEKTSPIGIETTVVVTGCVVVTG